LTEELQPQAATSRATAPHRAIRNGERVMRPGAAGNAKRLTHPGENAETHGRRLK
jgi:hypothetical protein